MCVLLVLEGAVEQMMDAAVFDHHPRAKDAHAIAAAVDAAVPLLRRGGRLIYAGAGTSVRIGVQDGAELFPTFSWPRDKVAFAIAGGEGALLRAVENAEDSAPDGVSRIAELEVGADDVVIGLAASGNTPYTVAAIEEARRRGALTIGIANNANTRLLSASEYPVLVETGPEAIAGSTRMKAGTAQKAALNCISTGVMIRLLSEQVESVQTAFFRAILSVVMLLPLMMTGKVKPWLSQRIAGHFWRTFMGTTSMVLGFYAISMLPLPVRTRVGTTVVAIVTGSA